MALRRKLSRLWQTLFHRSQLDRDLDEELREYLDSLIEKKITAGQDPAEARRAAMLEMGGVTQVKAAVQRDRIGAGLDALWQDVRFTCRSLLRKPGFALVAVITFALGIGANTAIFSIVNAVLIQPLPYKDSSQLVFVWGDITYAGYPRGPISGPELNDLRDRATLFSSFGGIWANSATIGDRNPEQLRIGWVTSNFFSTLGAPAFLGRTFEQSDEGSYPASSILLSFAAWQRLYGGDASVIGKRIIVNGQPTTLIGVMPADFRLMFPRDASVPEDLEAWLPFDHDLRQRPRRQNFLRVVGRLKSDSQLLAGGKEISEIAAGISRDYADYRAAPRIFKMVGLQSEGAREVRPGLIALLSGVAVLLLTACLNVASLLVARAASRTKETALRLAIGASHTQIVRQCLVEGLILALIGGIVGVLFGEFSLRALVAARPAALSRIGDARIDTVVLIFTGGTALFWGLLFSLAPMAEVIRTDVIGGVLGNTRHIGTARYRIRAALVTLQIAFGVVLLVGAGLMVRTFISIQRLDPGYRADRMLSFRLILPDKFPSQEAANEFHRRFQGEMLALPGVTGIGSVSHLPFDTIPNWGNPYYTRPDQDPLTAPFSDFRAVSPGYLEAIGARLLEGRLFTEADAPGSQPVVIVDDLLAKRSWPGWPAESAIGKRISIDPSVSGRPDRRGWATVIGVVKHMRIRSLVEELNDQVYMSIRQVPRPTTYVVQTSGDPAELAGATRAAIRRLEPLAPIYDVRLLEDYLAGARSVQRFTMFLSIAFAFVALSLAFVGVFGLISYSVNARRYEFGVRLALGARSGHILRLVLQEGIMLVAAGVIVGAAVAAVAARLLQSQLFGVTASDPPTYTIAIAVIGIAGLLASWLPARKASASNPLEVMRTD